jgi:AraC-like DNA-binding protein
LIILSMRYFDDLSFVDGGVHPRYAIHLDTTPGDISLELCSQGGMYHQHGDGPRQELPGAAVFWHQPGHRYRYGPLARQGWWYHHWVMIRGARAERIFADALAPLSPHHVLALVEVGELHRLFIELVGLVHGLRRRQGEAVAVLERILALLAVHDAPRGEQVGAIEALAMAIAERPFAAWDWSLEARRLGLSVAHFRRLFTGVVGAPPARHLLGVRMRAAAGTLLEDRRSVGTVAAGLGFGDQAVFTRCFTRVLGHTPRRWRAMHALPPIGG